MNVSPAGNVEKYNIARRHLGYTLNNGLEHKKYIYVKKKEEKSFHFKKYYSTMGLLFSSFFFCSLRKNKTLRLKLNILSLLLLLDEECHRN